MNGPATSGFSGPDDGADDPDGASLFGLVAFEGDDRAASRVLVPFPSAREADRYAQRNGLHDYVVAPLSFLAAR